ncbi:MAG TPA: hypothetical protein PKN95_13745 [Verrucomicrobiota bacterium]|nr:hypothetical protein [Verrucomicrobiota bacterium]
MKHTCWPYQGLAAAALVAGLLLPQTSHADQLARFDFNEGSGVTTTDPLTGLVGTLGQPFDVNVDFSQLQDSSPSGLPGDRCLTNSGAGFLIADDSSAAVLDIREGPITLETWLYIDGTTPALNAQGMIGYGGSYKMGLRGGWQVFTLFGLVDITNTVTGLLPSDQWVHAAAAWEPGVGVHFFVNGVETFVEYTNALSARAPVHHFLGLGSEGTSMSLVAAFDRMRIHHALLTAADLDNVAASPKAPLPTTLVSYNFDEASFPCTNAIAPELPAVPGPAFVAAQTSPEWASDSPTGQAGDYSLNFLNQTYPVRQFISFPGAAPFDLAVNDSSYTLQAWVKLPTTGIDARRVIYRTAGPRPQVSLSINVNRGLHTTFYGNADFASSVIVPNDNRWHHVAAVMDYPTANVHFYLDGVLRQTMTRTKTTGTSTANPPNPLTIGKESDTAFFHGSLDRVVIDNTALTAAQLDFPAAPGLATFPTLAAHPADVTTNLGATVVFTATPSSDTPVAVRWYYRAHLADPVGIPLNEQTTTLTLNNITDQDLGFYSLVVTNAAGVAESYAAQLQRTPVAGLIDFEAPHYLSGAVDRQDSWTTDANTDAARVLTATEIGAALSVAGQPEGDNVHGGDQALVVGLAGASSASIRPVAGVENATHVTFEFWARPFAGPVNGNIFITVENAAGTRAAGVRFGPATSIDYGLVSGAWVPTGLTWDSTNWYHLKFELDYDAHTYNFYVNGARQNLNPVPFYAAGSDSFRQIRVFRGSNQSGVIIDDVNIIPGLRITSITTSNNNVTIKWEGGQPPYQLQRRSALDGGTWEDVGGTTNGTEASDTMGTGSMFYRIRGN